MKNGQKLHVLLVDDNPTFCQLTSALLQENGYDVTVAEDGNKALDKLNQRDFDCDVMLIDLILPQRNGMDVLRAVRRHGKYQGTPAVLLSAAEPAPNLVEELKALESVALDKEKTLDFLIPMLDDLFKRVSERS